MTISELQRLAMAMVDRGLGDKEVRVGDQIESGQYLHASVGSVYEGTGQTLILSANDDEMWFDEASVLDDPDQELKILWPSEDKLAT